MDMMKKVPVREQDPKVRATNFDEVYALAIIKKRLKLRRSAALTARIPDVCRDVP